MGRKPAKLGEVRTFKDGKQKVKKVKTDKGWKTINRWTEQKTLDGFYLMFGLEGKEAQ